MRLNEGKLKEKELQFSITWHLYSAFLLIPLSYLVFKHSWPREEEPGLVNWRGPRNGCIAELW